MKSSTAATLAILLCATPAHAADGVICKTVGSSWEWFGDHAALWVEYYAVGEAGRQYEVGTGMSINGSPWGSRNRYSGESTFSAYGLGAVHVRQADSGTPFRICVGAEGLATLTIVRITFSTGG